MKQEDAETMARFALERGLKSFSDEDVLSLCRYIVGDMRREIENAAYKQAAQLAQDCFPPAHTYASENGDLYAAQDSASRIIASAIRSLITPAKTADTEG